MRRCVVAVAIASLLAAACDNSGAIPTPATTPVEAGPTEVTAAPAAPAAPEAKTLVGTDGEDTLEGGPGHDHLTGGAGADTLDGKDGFDYARYDEAKAAIVASLSNPGQNTGDAKGDKYISLQGVVGSALFGDTLTGNEETNDLHGLGEADFLYGLGGADGLEGGEGDDTLDGGEGADTYVGGAGKDTFVFNRGEANGDTISDFEGAGSGSGDKIVLVNYGNGATFVYRDGNVWVVSAADGKTVEEIHVTNAAAIAPGDYTFK